MQNGATARNNSRLYSGPCIVHFPFKKINKYLHLFYTQCTKLCSAALCIVLCRQFITMGFGGSKTHLAETFCASQKLDSLTLNHGKMRSICCNINMKIIFVHQHPGNTQYGGVTI